MMIFYKMYVMPYDSPNLMTQTIVGFCVIKLLIVNHYS